METQYMQLSQAERAKAYHKAWSLSGMEAHLKELGQDVREVTYIGSTENDQGKITDYYKDTAGWYWYDVRYRTPAGDIVPIEVKIFGDGFLEREKKRKRRRWLYDQT